ncbi:hypothetical protein AVV36_gp215 [Pectobacterium bacteriophage PM2]|uniref:Tail fiber protein n=1 Tax=Pectobacterium bacteriophage PM2 TaxID=1429794 RepID=A0A0A0Q2H3_9CAUD|nr:hypothetical protein AVV36_gp215 [Pectobacterium bacteriophage PM2]AHY25195.1 hypothetical protein PM2_233 [Pectobacterium bacteriophage PM2]
MIKLTIDQKIALREILKTKFAMSVSDVVFEKADGTIRTMKGTRDKDIISKLVGVEIYENYINPTKPRSESVDMVPLFDTEIKEWRGFSINQLISVNGMKVSHLLQFVG